jgi:acyl-CoA oxidase
MGTHRSEERTTLAEVLRHGDPEFHERLQKILTNPDFRVTEEMSQVARRQNAYGQLADLVKEIGARDVATDLPKLFAVFDQTAILTPDLIPLISGHYNLATGSLATLTDPDTAKPYLTDLDDGSSVGVMLLTEYGAGSNIGFMEMTATWDGEGFVLNTPVPLARKFMPSLGTRVPRVCVIGARLIDAEGVDQGVHLFAARLRDDNGDPAPGVTITPLDDQPMVVMDNSVIEFDNFWVDRSAWLIGNLATIDDRGLLTWRDEESRKRVLALAISQLTVGRLALSSCLNATARTSLYIALRYATKRRVPLTPSAKANMIDIPHVKDTLLTDLAGTVARTIYGNAVKTFLAGADLTDRETVVAVMAAKYFIQDHALATVTDCRLKMAAQGMFSANRVADYIGICHAAITGEGDTKVMGSVGGRVLAKSLGGTPPPEPTLHDLTDPIARTRLLRARVLTIAQEAQPLLADPALEARLDVVPDALDLAEAYSAEQALQLLDELAELHPELAAVRDVFALNQIDQHASWYLTHGLLDIAAVKAMKQPGRRGLLPQAIDNLADNLPALLDAFGFDDAVLGAPVLSDDLPAAWDSRLREQLHH